jgi:flagellar basal-body rod protein FlgB
MIESILQATPFGVVEQMARFAQARHTVLAGNIANLDTPGYRARDLSPELFRRRLAEALMAQRSASAMPLGGAGQGSAAAWAGAGAGPTHRPGLEHATDDLKSLLRHDENDVGLEQQVAAVAKNQLEHNLALAVMSNQVRLLQAAISERV